MVSKPLFKQSIKANWTMWLAVTVGMCVILTTINMIMGSMDFSSLHQDEELLAQYVTLYELYNTGSLSVSLDLSGVPEELLPFIPENFTISLPFDPSTIPSYILELLPQDLIDKINLLPTTPNLSYEGFLTAMGVDAEKLTAMSTMDIDKFIQDMYYTMAGVMLAMIYVIVTANKLVAAQVDRGSMAYVLSTPTKRSAVMWTQMLFMVLSLFGMFFITAGVGLLTQWIGYGGLTWADAAQVLLLNLGGFCVMLAVSGICFMASCLFSLSKHSLAVGGSITVFFFVCKILGMFGQPDFVNLGMGVEAMNVFNYMTIVSLLDSTAIATIGTEAVSLAFLWKFAILIGIAVVTYAVGMWRFTKKDLPL